ncbi:uncharacterized protein LOC127601386 [Hippocampus zosterae]|uniref:uncharacterized protein LOC127601386 n=1 Tax=Hippocampus zosterae TaxID=109293 RepID=UPI00223D12FB|nr:uncharacterized protein LOC127601386 [Hippocampus zosterae]XP_051922546.1 uncharacterized protein LOC127601386 [Hippocampus zosterae]
MASGKASEERDEGEPGPSFTHSRPHMRNNKLALRLTRKVELGWIHEGKQQRKNQGGGTIRLDVSKDTKKADILQIALDPFFPNGTSRKGKLEDFCVDILDFQEDAVLDDDVSVGELYSVLKMGMLRFYLCTTLKEFTDSVLTKPEGGHTWPEEGHIGPSDPTANTSEQHDAVISSVSFSSADISTPANANFDRTNCQITNINIKLHRTNLLDELISKFIDPNLLVSPLTFVYINEIGADATVMSRDVYSAFWTEFFDYATEGQDMRVPILSPKRKEEEWKSVGRILMKGFQDHGYFPCRLVKAFTVALLFGENAVTPDLLFESFLSYISQEERDLVNKALKEDLDDEEQEEMIDFLGRVGAKCIPARENLKTTLSGVAHKLIIQQPKYALDKMSEALGPKLRQAFDSVDSLQQIYENVKPTTKTSLKLLEASPSTPAGHQSLCYLTAVYQRTR